MKEFVRQVHKFRAKVIALSFLGTNAIGTGTEAYENYIKLLDVDILSPKDSGHVEVDESDLTVLADYTIFAPKNIFCDDGVIVTSITKTGGMDDVYIRNAIWGFHEKVGLKHELQTLIITGSHGNLDGKDATTSSRELEKSFYLMMCNYAGVKPSTDLDGVNKV